MKKHEKFSYLLAAGLLLNSLNLLFNGRILPFSLPDAVHIALSLIAIGLIIAGIVTTPAVRNSRFRQAKLRLIRKVFGRKTN